VWFDLVALDEIGAGIAGLNLVELVAEGERLGPPEGGERVEPDEQLAGAGADVAGDGEGLAGQRVGLVAGARNASPGRGRARFGRCRRPSGWRGRSALSRPRAGTSTAPGGCWQPGPPYLTERHPSRLIHRSASGSWALVVGQFEVGGAL
jgi:hypothetical protein